MKTTLALAAIAAAGVVHCAAAPRNYDVAAYVWPAYQPAPRWAELGIFKKGIGEWQSVQEAVPKWEGHLQPLKPLWGYGNEADPQVVARKIDAAVQAGVNVFIYDWYWYESRPFLEDALNNGFLAAENRGKMKFFIMWANHSVVKLWDNKAADKQLDKPIWHGGVGFDEFKKLVARWIDRYFRQPNYYRIQGKPVLMIYTVPSFCKGIGGCDAAAKAVDYLRSECVKAGLGGVHLMVSDHGISVEHVKKLGIDSGTIYNLVHWSNPAGNPEFTKWADIAVKRFDAAVKELPYKAYFPHASIGWDNNPRYPPGSVQPAVVGGTPEKFERLLRKVKDWSDRNTPAGYPQLITINSWNEWTEGSYLEPDEHFGYGYLEAVRRVFRPGGKPFPAVGGGAGAK
ncbi:MAG: glycoside hydrolase family 99-like domain-containing protein [Kiritimatiellae bacterium]|nr:glycoside hydrolase family 99-like domain-containing protein [Kiritimatiellia bacterium]